MDNGDNPSWSLAENGGPAHGTVTISADGSYTYTPVANYNGTDSFTVTGTVSDGHGGTTTQTVTLNIIVVNNGPVAADVIASGTEDTPKTGRLTASSVDGDTPPGRGGLRAEPMPTTPWGTEMRFWMQRHGLSEEMASTVVMWRWLQKGDVRAVAALMESGRAPPPVVLKELAKMLWAGIGAEAAVYPLKVKGKPQNCATEVLDFRLADNVVQRIASGMSKNEAVSEVASIGNIGEEKVRRAYRLHKDLFQGKKPAR